MRAEILYATNNSGKFNEVAKYLESLDIIARSPEDLEIDIDVDEDGNSLEENAKLKALGFFEHAPHMIVVADDTGVEIDALGGEPNIHARRWRDHQTRMTDPEIIAYCLEQLKGVPIEQRGAQYRTVIAVVGPKNIQPEFFNGIMRGVLLDKPTDNWAEGFPFDSLFYLPEFQAMVTDIRNLPVESRPDFLSQREEAFQAAAPRIKQLFASQ